MRYLLRAATVSAVCLLSGCGSDDDAPAPPPTTPVPAPPTPPSIAATRTVLAQSPGACASPRDDACLSVVSLHVDSSGEFTAFWEQWEVHRLNYRIAAASAPASPNAPVIEATIATYTRRPDLQFVTVRPTRDRQFAVFEDGDYLLPPRIRQLSRIVSRLPSGGFTSSSPYGHLFEPIFPLVQDADGDFYRLVYPTFELPTPPSTTRDMGNGVLMIDVRLPAFTVCKHCTGNRLD